MKRKQFLIWLLLLNLIMTSCSTQKQYQKAIEEFGFVENGKIIRDQTTLCWENLKVQLADENEQIEPVSGLNDLKSLIDNTIASSGDFQKENTKFQNNQQSYTDILLSYQEIVNTMNSAMTVLEEVNLHVKAIEEAFNGIKSVVLSGTTTTMEYNEGLSEFLDEHGDVFFLFDLEQAKNLLGRKDITREEFEVVLDKATPVQEELKKLVTYSDVDVTVNQLLVHMSEEVVLLYRYTMENYDEIKEYSEPSYITDVNLKISETSTKFNEWLKNVE